MGSNITVRRSAHVISLGLCVLRQFVYTRRLSEGAANPTGICRGEETEYLRDQHLTSASPSSVGSLCGVLGVVNLGKTSIVRDWPSPQSPAVSERLSTDVPKISARGGKGAKRTPAGCWTAGQLELLKLLET